MNKQFLKPKEASVFLNCSYDSLINWDKNGSLIAFRTPTKRRFYTKEQLLKFLGRNQNKKPYYGIKLRLSGELFDSLKIESNKKNLSMADYVRSVLESNLLGKSETKSDVEMHYGTIETRLNSVLNSLEKQVIPLEVLDQRLEKIESRLDNLDDETESDISDPGEKNSAKRIINLHNKSRNRA